MSELNEHVLEEAGSRGDKLIVNDLVVLIERYDGRDEPGVAVDRVVEYAERLAAQNAPVQPEKVPAAIDERRSTAETWQADAAATGTWFGSGSLYELDEGRVSVFPRRWHEELTGETDLKRYLDVVGTSVADDGTAEGQSVPEAVLLNAATVLGGLSWQAAKSQLETLRDEGVVNQPADQHPYAQVEFQPGRTDH